MTTIKTLQDAIDAGYMHGDKKTTKTYVKAETKPASEIPVFRASGAREGQLYFLIHNPFSNQYGFRQYLVKRK